MKTKTPVDLAFEHKARLFYIKCAEHVFDLAPLPEFSESIAWLKIYDENPTDRNREALKKAYRSLASKRNQRGYGGYTAVGEFYYGLIHIIYYSLFKPDSAANYDVQRFTEACYCAGEALRCNTAFRSISSLAQNKEHEWQTALYDELFGSEKESATLVTTEVAVAA
jgi:hypothetical protein